MGTEIKPWPPKTSKHFTTDRQPIPPNLRLLWTGKLRIFFFSVTNNEIMADARLLTILILKIKNSPQILEMKSEEE